MKIYQLIWSYECKPETAAEFEKEYAQNGAWFKFFEPCDDFLGQDLAKNIETGHYILTDKWISRASYEGHIAENKAEYDRLCEQFKALYEKEVLIGRFETVSW
ncbi:MAG: hypothetical protein RIC30_02290 [Marinoscillum sp.]|uniref:hypothetical protein n=1 Tax=Marinoscillum sp. TaxID=2024838 RepID=UPI0032F7A3A0